MISLPAPKTASARLALHVDDVVGHQAVAAHDQVEGDLALADARLAEQQDADAEDVEQHPVHRGLGGEDVLQVGLHRVDEGRGEVGGAQQRHRRPPRRRRSSRPATSSPLVTTRQAMSSSKKRGRHLGLPLRREGAEVAHLGVAEDLDPLPVQVVGEAGQRQAGLLDAGGGDAAVQAPLAGQQGRAAGRTSCRRAGRRRGWRPFGGRVYPGRRCRRHSAGTGWGAPGRRRASDPSGRVRSGARMELDDPLPRPLLRRLRLGRAAGPLPGRAARLAGHRDAPPAHGPPAGRPLPGRRLLRRAERLRRLPLLGPARAPLVVRPPPDGLPGRRRTGPPSRPTAPASGSGTRRPPPAPASSSGPCATASAGRRRSSRSWSAGPRSSTPPASPRRRWRCGWRSRRCRIMTLLEATRDPALPDRIIEAMRRRPLAEIAAAPWVAEPLAPVLERHRAAIALFRERARLEQGVVAVDLVGTGIDAPNKFIAYDLFPEARYTVVVTEGPGRTKVSVGSNPWPRVPRTHDIAALCASATAAAATRWWARSRCRPGRPTRRAAWPPRSPPRCAWSRRHDPRPVHPGGRRRRRLPRPCWWRRSRRPATRWSRPAAGRRRSSR